MARPIRLPFPQPRDEDGNARELNDAEVAQLERFFAHQLAALPSNLELAIWGAALLVAIVALIVAAVAS